MTEAITIIQTRRSATGFGLVHPHHSVLKQLKLFSTDSQALEASTCRYTPFCSVPFCALSDGYAYTGNAALTSMMCIKWSRQTAVDSRLPLQCYIQECVGVQWHSQVGRRLATIHISCILLLCCIFKPH